MLHFTREKLWGPESVNATLRAFQYLCTPAELEEWGHWPSNRTAM